MRDAIDPARVVPGAAMFPGTPRFRPVVRIEQVDDDGQVHFVAVPADDPAAVELLARASRDLTGPLRKIPKYQRCTTPSVNSGHLKSVPGT